jgi:hypothetical protein
MEIRLSDDSEKANIFGKYFGSVFTTDDGSLPAIQSRIEESISLDSIDFSVDKVHKTLMRLNLVLHCGPDGLPNVILKIWRAQSVLRSRIFSTPPLVHTIYHPNGFKHTLFQFLKKNRFGP